MFSNSCITYQSTAVTKVATYKLFSIFFLNDRKLCLNRNCVHHHLQTKTLHALFLTETKIKPLDPDNNAALPLHLSKWWGLRIYYFWCIALSPKKRLYFQPWCSTHMAQNFIPSASKYICCLYCSPNPCYIAFPFLNTPNTAKRIKQFQLTILFTPGPGFLISFTSTTPVSQGSYSLTLISTSTRPRYEIPSPWKRMNMKFTKKRSLENITNTLTGKTNLEGDNRPMSCMHYISLEKSKAFSSKSIC